jgi:4a-hydroxytetrahydrobiopterin dehydratase
MTDANRPALLDAETVRARLADLDGWTGDEAAIERSVECPTFLAGIDLVRRVAQIAEEIDHHPDIDIRWRTVRFGLSTHSAGGVTESDLTLAKRIDAAARTP